MISVCRELGWFEKMTRTMRINVENASVFQIAVDEKLKVEEIMAKDKFEMIECFNSISKVLKKLRN